MTQDHFDVLSDRRPEGWRPQFSVIIASYNVEDYVRSTIKSLTQQTIDRAKLEFIVVDDASSDGTREIVRQWANQDERVVLAQMVQNSGVAAVRNAALSLARGAWVTSVDPDDIVAEDYFEEVSRCIAADRLHKVAMFSARRFITNDSNGNFKDAHPLGPKFRKGNRAVSLNEHPNDFEMGATSFLRRDVLLEHGLTFDESVRPAFEDGHLIARYLCHWSDPIHGLVGTAVYYYRKRATGNSLVQSGWAKPDKYTSQVKRGYVDALEYAEAKLGYIPDWLACQILYDIVWYFKEWETTSSQGRGQSPEVLHQFMEYLDELTSYITFEQLSILRVNRPSFELLQALELGVWKTCRLAHLNQCYQTAEGQRLYILNVAPQVTNIEILVNGEPVEVVADGVKNYSYFGRTLMREYAFVLPAGGATARVDGQVILPVPFTDEAMRRVVNRDVQAVDASLMRVKKQRTSWQKRARRLRVKSLILGESSLGVATAVIGRRIRGAVVKDSGKFQAQHLKREVAAYAKDHVAEFRDAWLILDHQHRADDNGEHLYRYIAANRPDINAFFVLDKTSKDWPRLEAEGFRLLEYGTVRAYAAAQRAAVVASSDAIAECMYLAPRNIFGTPSYRFVFLQHGVTMNDISAWLNPKSIPLITAATKDEAVAFVWNNSGYSFTTAQVALTGFARFDALYERRRAEVESGAALPASLFVMPTWRRHLYLELLEATSDEDRARILNVESYMADWIKLIRSEAIAAMASQGTVRFALHPNLRSYVQLLDLPDYVEPIAIDEVSIQDLIFDSGVFITDFSSLSVDFALAGRRICYFQPAASEVIKGQHSWNPGYFDYERDGWGPVLTDPECGEQIASFARGERPEWDAMAIERRSVFDATVDGSASERIVDSIEALLAGSPQPYPVYPPSIS